MFILNFSLAYVSCWTLLRIEYIMDVVAWQDVANISFPLGVAAGGSMDRFWNGTGWDDAKWIVLWVAVLAALVAVAAYVIGKIHPKSVQKEPTASQWLSKYRDLHSQGKITDEEFRTIKTTLAEQLQDELNDNGETGYTAGNQK